MCIRDRSHREIRRDEILLLIERRRVALLRALHDHRHAIVVFPSNSRRFARAFICVARVSASSVPRRPRAFVVSSRLVSSRLVSRLNLATVETHRPRPRRASRRARDARRRPATRTIDVVPRAPSRRAWRAVARATRRRRRESNRRARAHRAVARGRARRARARSIARVDAHRRDAPA